MNDIDKMPSKCRDCPYWERAAEPYVCSDCTTPVKKCGGDYILRSDALEYFGNYLPGYSILKDDVIRGINELPAADVEPARYAEWISPDGISICSACGTTAPYDEEGDIDFLYLPKLHFCPNCGCRMNVEGRNGN